jgi:serine/threonine-protein kinase RsbW
MAAKADTLGSVTQFVRNGAREAGLPEPRLRELDLLIEEILMNIYRYAYPKESPGMVTITYSLSKDGELAVEVRDQGVAFDPLTASPPNLSHDLTDRPIGGLGIVMMRSFAKSLAYRRENGWNLLSFGISANL